MNRVLAIHLTCWPIANEISKVVQGKSDSRNMLFAWHVLRGVQLNAVKMRLHYEINMYFGNELKHSGPRIHFDIKNQMKKCLAPFSEEH